MRWFSEQGFEVHYASAGEQDVPDCDVHFKVPFRRSPFRVSNIRAFFKLKQIIGVNNYDIIHTHTPMGGAVTRLASRRSRAYGTKVVYTAHGLHFFKGAPVFNWLIYLPVEWLLSFVTDELVLINREDYDFAKLHFHARNTRYLKGGVGVDVNRFSKVDAAYKLRLRDEYGHNDSDIIFVYIAEFIKRKNHKALIDAFLYISQSLPNAKLILCGSGQLLAKTKQYAKELNISDRIHFLGYRTDTEQLLRLSDVYVSTSKQEGLPIGVIEAAEVGLSLVLSDNRGHKEVFELLNNHNAIVYRGSAELSLSMLKMAAARQKSFVGARDSASDLFSVESALAAMEDIYDLRPVSALTVSVVLPAYNSVETIIDSLVSVYSQNTVTALHEVIVVDDGSSDSTVAEVRNFIKKNKIKNLILIEQENQGPSAARNRGIELATGDWIAFLDADDMWSVDKLKVQMHFIRKFKRIRIISSDSNMVKLSRGVGVDENLSRYGVLAYFIQSRIATPSVIVRRKDIMKAGMFDERMKFAEDQNLFMKLIRMHGVYHVTLPLVVLSSKPVYGASGLSGNLRSMHDGVMYNIKFMHRAGSVSLLAFIFLSSLEQVKYINRIVRTKYRIVFRRSVDER